MRFTATLDRVGINRCVDVPARVTRALGTTGRIAVHGTIEGIAFRSTLMPRGQGLHRLFVHSRVWRPRGLAVGDSVHVRLDLDADADAVPVPPFLSAAFRRRAEARAAFLRQTPALRREIVRWLAAARRSGTRERRLEEMLDRLETGNLRHED